MRTTMFSALALSAALSLTLPATASDVATDSTVQIEAVPSSFNPGTITIHTGVTTKIAFVRTQGVHEIESRDLGIPQTMLTPGKDVTVEVTPKKPGTYLLHCEIVCGDDHENMVLKIVVR